ncbi:unnamed protein product [Scytosiphon promiscuus]
MLSFRGRTDTVIVAIDVVIVVGTTICTLASLGYIAAMARMRRNFFIVLRSPFLACMFGLCSALRYCSLTYEYALAWGDDSTDPEHWIACLIAYPAQLTAEIALVLIAFRLLVMFYPAKRAKYGRYIKEKPLTRGLACAYALMEVAVWVSAAAEGIPRTAQVVSLVRPLSAVINIVAAVSLGGRLREVDDLSNMSRDVCVVGLLLLLKQSLQAGFLLVPMSPLVLKYYNIAFVALSYVPIVWIINIRPVREVLRHIPERRRSTVEILLLSPHRKVSASNGGRRVVATADVADSPARQDREAYVDSNRLTSIMTFLPLRAAFGEYCQKALCGESFEFLLGVYEFKDLLDDVGEESGKGFGGFGGHLAIVNDYIKDGSHSEVNIASRTKRNIMRYNKFKDYALLSLVREMGMGQAQIMNEEERKGIYTDAEHEVSKMLGDNLLNKFLASDTYKKVVDFEGLSQQ